MWVCSSNQAWQFLSWLTHVLFKERLRQSKRLWAKRLFNDPCQSLPSSIPPQWSRASHTLFLLIQENSSQGTTGHGLGTFSLTNLIRCSIFCCYLDPDQHWDAWDFRALERHNGAFLASRRFELSTLKTDSSGGVYQTDSSGGVYQGGKEDASAETAGSKIWVWHSWGNHWCLCESSFKWMPRWQ